jgi:hypothetical protein
MNKGFLWFGGRNFEYSAGDIGLDASNDRLYFTTTVQDSKGNFIKNQRLRLDDRIHNENGVLTYYDWSVGTG